MKISKKDVINKIVKHVKTRGMKPGRKGYVKSNQENLIGKFNNWKEIQFEFDKGQGSELKPDSSGIIKFNAIHSSSALCVNNFAPFKQNKYKFKFFNYVDFTEATFEKKLPTGISTPNLDFYLETGYEVIGFESKFTEILDAKLPNKDGNLGKYQNRKELNYLPVGFSDVIQEYIDCKDKIYLDVAQLIKHSIGLINKGNSKYEGCPNKMFVQPILVYIYWQPVNWYHFDVFQKHADEINEFKKRIQSHLTFIPLSYLEFWKYFENDRTFGIHIEKVKKRYQHVL